MPSNVATLAHLVPQISSAVLMKPSVECERQLCQEPSLCWQFALSTGHHLLAATGIERVIRLKFTHVRLAARTTANVDR